MQKDTPNKAMTSADVKNKDADAPAQTEYFFPEHGVTIKADSEQEATAKLQEIINNK